MTSNLLTKFTSRTHTYTSYFFFPIYAHLSSPPVPKRYGPIFVAVAQYLWVYALERCNPSIISIGTSSTFVLNLLWSMIINKRMPSTQELAGGSIIVVSIVSSLMEKRRTGSSRRSSSTSGSGFREDRSTSGASDRAVEEGIEILPAEESTGDSRGEGGVEVHENDAVDGKYV